MLSHVFTTSFWRLAHVCLVGFCYFIGGRSCVGHLICWVHAQEYSFMKSKKREQLCGASIHSWNPRRESNYVALVPLGLGCAPLCGVLRSLLWQCVRAGPDLQFPQGSESCTWALACQWGDGFVLSHVLNGAGSLLQLNLIGGVRFRRVRPNNELGDSLALTKF